MRLQNQQNMIFGRNSYGKSLNRIGNLEQFSKIIFFQTCMKIIPGDPLHTLKARKHLKHVFELEFDR
jgi:hypothetical protein|tara:strand:- start:201 stop:401 length:201 start_codon:yes stop_codon:yes gene_type:complete